MHVITGRNDKDEYNDVEMFPINLIYSIRNFLFSVVKIIDTV
jgi:hypothetical protein